MMVYVVSIARVLGYTQLDVDILWNRSGVKFAAGWRASEDDLDFGWMEILAIIHSVHVNEPGNSSSTWHRILLTGSGGFKPT